MGWTTSGTAVRASTATSAAAAASHMDDAIRADMAAYTGCIAGALTEAEFRVAFDAAGLTDVEIGETHRVHPEVVQVMHGLGIDLANRSGG